MMNALALILLWLSATAAFQGVYPAAQLQRSRVQLSAGNLNTDFEPSSGRPIIDVVGLKKIAALAVSSVLAVSNAQRASAAGDLVVVLGSNGKTGKLIVELLAKKGKNVRPAVRDEKKGAAFKSLGSSVEGPVSADVTKLDTLAGAITGASAVIFAASASSKGGSAQQVDYVGVENVAKECVRLGIPRLIVISSGAITKPDSLGFKITNLFGGIMDYKLKGENALRNVYSGAEKSSGFVIIRPGGLMDNFASGVGSIELNQGDTISGEVNRADVAECAVAAALSSTIPRNVIFEMYEGGRSSPLQKEFPAVSGFERSGATLGADYEILFKGLKSDSS